MAGTVPVFILSLGLTLFPSSPGLAAPPSSLQAHCRALPSEGLMAKAIEVLMDHQYVVQCASGSLGLISFTKVVQSGSYASKHLVKIQGSMVFGPQKNGPAVVRMLIHQEWQDAVANGLTSSGVETDTDESYYKELFDDLQLRMAGAQAPRPPEGASRP